VAKIDPVMTVVESTPHALLIRLDAQQLQSLDQSGLAVLEQLQQMLLPAQLQAVLVLRLV